ncbi:MAG: MFS transporter [Jatrophihabitans sp.]
MTVTDTTAPRGEVATPDASGDGLAPSAHWGALAVVLSAIFMSTLDFFIVNVAIPSTQADLDASASAIQWIVAGFSLAIGTTVITAGRLGDLFGKRRMFGMGLALFIVTSALCGLAPSADALVGARVAQGLAASLMTPQVLAIIGTVYTGKALTRAFTAYGLTMGLAAVFGQLIGGVLIHSDVFGLGWRACFLINVPVGALALALTRRLVPATPGTGRQRLDLVGTLLIGLTLASLTVPLIQGQSQGWPLWTWLSLAACAVLASAFARYQFRLVRRGRIPLIDLRMFTDRAFATGMVVQVISWMGQASFFLVFALYLQEGLHLTALTSGLVFTAIGGGYIASSIGSAAVVGRLGRQTVTIGAFGMIVGLEMLSLAVQHIGTDGAVVWLLPGLIVDGAGMGLIIAPMASIVLARVARQNAGAASGVLSTAMQIGGALGVAVIGIIFYGSLQHSGSSPSAVPHAFTASVDFLIAVAVAVMIGMQFIPKDGSPVTAGKGSDK